MELHQAVELQFETSTLLPNEILVKIFRFLDTESLLIAARVCQQWEAAEVLSMNRRISVEPRPAFCGTGREQASGYCESLFSLSISETETEEPKIIGNGGIGLLVTSSLCSEGSSGKSSFQSQLLYQALVHLPNLDWAPKVFHLTLDFRNGVGLTGRDVNSIAPFLLRSLKSLKCFSVTVLGCGGNQMERSFLPAMDGLPDLNTSMLELELVYAVEADEERRKTSGNVFLDVGAFVALCPNLERLYIGCIVERVEYGGMGKRLDSGNLSIVFYWTPTSKCHAQSMSPVPTCKHVASIFTGIPIQDLRILRKDLWPLVEAMVNGTRTLQEVTLASTSQDDCKILVSIPELIQSWDRNPAFRYLTDVRIEVPDFEDDDDLPRGTVPSIDNSAARNLANVAKLRLNGTPPKVSKVTEAYWRSLLQWMPNVEKLWSNSPISAFKCQVRMLPRLKHVVRSYTPVDAGDVSVFESHELSDVLESVKELETYGLHVPWESMERMREEHMKAFNEEIQAGLRLIQKSAVKLLKLNKNKLSKEAVDKLLKDEGSKYITCRLFYHPMSRDTESFITCTATCKMDSDTD